MYAQLGNIVFSGLFAPNSWSEDGNEATYAEFALIGGKPRLQKTGDSLQDLSLEMVMHAEFCNPQNQLEQLRLYKTNGEILPLLMGNGRYVSDYVIISCNPHIDQAFADGTVVQMTVQLELKEYVSYNKKEQQQLATRKKAFAVGNKKPIATRPPQPATLDSQTARYATEAKQQTTKIDNQVAEFSDNPSKRPLLKDQITESCKTANDKLESFRDQLTQAKYQQDKYTAMRALAAEVKTAATAIIALYPYNDIDDLRDSNTYLQGVVRTFSRTTSPLLEDVITRQS